MTTKTDIHALSRAVSLLAALGGRVVARCADEACEICVPALDLAA